MELEVEKMYQQHIRSRPIAEQLQLMALISKQFLQPQPLDVTKLQHMYQQVKQGSDKIAIICQRWQIIELALIDTELNGSIKIMADFSPTTQWSLFDHIDMQDELQAILGDEVELVTRQGIEHSPYYLPRQTILNSAQVIYALS